MAKAVQVNVLDGQLGLQPGSNQNTIMLMGCCLGNNAGGGVPNTLANIGDPITAVNQLKGGELLELVDYVLKASPGSTVQVMPLNPTTRGGVGSVTKVGTGALTITPSLAPHGTITITCTVGGTLGTAVFTFGVTDPITGVTVTSAPVTSAASWSSTGYQIPGTYCTWTATAGTYVAGGTPDIYTISTLGVITHPQGTGPAVGTQTSSPVDAYSVLITITLSGAVGTSQFTYSLDGGNTTSATVTSSASYAIPGTGIVLGFSGSANATDTYTFSSAPPTFTTTDLGNAGTALTTTYINAFQSSMVGVVGSVASAAAWATMAASAETQALALVAKNIYTRWFIGGPTVGTILPNAGSITVDSADTDSVVQTARAGMNTPHVCVAAGDGTMLGAYSSLVFRRNAVWGAIGRAAGVPASQDIGEVAIGGLTSFLSCVRDDFANGLSFYNSGITSLQTYGAGSAVFINRGLMGVVSTSDYYPLTNSRVVDQGCAIAVTNARPYTLSRIPTQTRNGTPGTIREDYAQRIENKMNTAEIAGLPVAPLPQGNAVAAVCTVTRTNNIFSTGQLIINVAIQPYSYPTQIVVNIGMSLQAS